jgi:hypothetical protein
MAIIKSKSGDYIEKMCLECCGEGEMSACCQDYVNNGRCAACGRFCKTDYCCECQGEGRLRFCKGDEVEVFVCVWSPEYLKELLYMPKKVGDTKTYRGEITKIIDDWNAEVKLRGKRDRVKIHIEELQTF